MTPEEFIREYLDLSSRIGVQQTLVQTVQKQLDDLEAAQAVLSASHLAELTPLRSRQNIELCGINEEGFYDWSLPVKNACVQIFYCAHVAADGAEPVSYIIDGDEDYKIAIRVWVTFPDMSRAACSLELTPQPGAQWRYPEAACAASLGGGKEVQS